MMHGELYTYSYQFLRDMSLTAYILLGYNMEIQSLQIICLLSH